MTEAAHRAWARAFREAMQSAPFPALLRRHRLYPHALTGAALDDFVAERIAGYADGEHADLVVAGAYTKSGFRKMVFGSSTTKLLEEAKVPLFLYH